MRLLTNIAVLALSGLTLSVVAAQAQTATPPKCGIEVYSQADQRYVSTPCTGQESNQAANASGGQKCGVEGYSQADQKYSSVPCPAGTTWENPAGDKSVNPNSK